MSNDSFTLNNIRLAAMNMLAMREHSARELQQKLLRRFDDMAMVDAAIAGLTADGLQSDQRFADAFVVMRVRQGKGPVRIGLELKERGVASAIINRSMDTSDESWLELASTERSKRFGAEVPRDMKEKSRQMKFLQYRGFTPSQIGTVFK